MIRQRNRCFELYPLSCLKAKHNGTLGSGQCNTSVQSSGSPAFPRQTCAEWDNLTVWKQMIQVRDVGQKLIN